MQYVISFSIHEDIIKWGFAISKVLQISMRMKFDDVYNALMIIRATL